LGSRIPRFLTTQSGEYFILYPYWELVYVSHEVAGINVGEGIGVGLGVGVTVGIAGDVDKVSKIVGVGEGMIGVEVGNVKLCTGVISFWSCEGEIAIYVPMLNIRIAMTPINIVFFRSTSLSSLLGGAL
jgi:hypothetical protein